MANVIDNTIMNSSLPWPTSSQQVGQRLPAGQVDAELNPGRESAVLRSPVADSGRGWLQPGLGRKVDLLA